MELELEGVFSVITNLQMDLFQALTLSHCPTQRPPAPHHGPRALPHHAGPDGGGHGHRAVHHHARLALLRARGRPLQHRHRGLRQRVRRLRGGQCGHSCDGLYSTVRIYKRNASLQKADIMPFSLLKGSFKNLCKTEQVVSTNPSIQ